MSERTIQSIRDTIGAQYGALDAPTFWFTQEALARQPYESILRQLAVDFTIEEDTDTNYDVAFEYMVYQGDCRWRLELSMVGPYAVLLRGSDTTAAIVVTMSTPGLTNAEKALLLLLAEHGLWALDQHILSQPIALRLTNADLEHTCLYQALFSDVAGLPWMKP
jgi:hypothetical protein